MAKSAWEAFFAFWIAYIIAFPLTGTAQTVFAVVWCVLGALHVVGFALEAYKAYLMRKLCALQREREA